VAWYPVDAVLASRELSNMIVVLATLGVALFSARDTGLDGLVSNLPGFAVCWGAVYGLIRAGRRRRGISPLEHETPPRPDPVTATRWRRLAWRGAAPPGR
jgi:hypothetical protein